MKLENIFITIISILAIISVLYIRAELKKPVSTETMIEIYNIERASECYGDHEYHCNEYYDEIIRTIKQSK